MKNTVCIKCNKKLTVIDFYDDLCEAVLFSNNLQKEMPLFLEQCGHCKSQMKKMKRMQKASVATKHQFPKPGIKLGKLLPKSV
jgi:hypothetical protein